VCHYCRSRRNSTKWDGRVICDSSQLCAASHGAVPISIAQPIDRSIDKSNQRVLIGMHAGVQVLQVHVNYGSTFEASFGVEWQQVRSVIDDLDDNVRTRGFSCLGFNCFEQSTSQACCITIHTHTMRTTASEDAPLIEIHACRVLTCRTCRTLGLS
jgi:hypothetical protein